MKGIETLLFTNFEDDTRGLLVRKASPMRRGLRRRIVPRKIWTTFDRVVRKASPMRRGLRQIVVSATPWHEVMSVRKASPMRRGLRRICGTISPGIVFGAVCGSEGFPDEKGIETYQSCRGSPPGPPGLDVRKASPMRRGLITQKPKHQAAIGRCGRRFGSSLKLGASFASLSVSVLRLVQLIAFRTKTSASDPNFNNFVLAFRIGTTETN